MKFPNSYLVLLAFLAMVSTSHAEDLEKGSQKLSVTLVEGEGSCVVEGQWVPVKGQYIYWEITGQGLFRRHEYNRFVPLDIHYHPTNGLARSSHFQLRLEFEEARRHYPESFPLFIQNSPIPDALFAEKLSKETGKHLIGATLIQEVSESDLYRLNRLKDSSPFKEEWSDRTINIPTRYSACEMQLNYKMNKAIALFRKNIFGKLQILKDDTKPQFGSDKTFAEGLLYR